MPCKLDGQTKRPFFDAAADCTLESVEAMVRYANRLEFF